MGQLADSRMEAGKLLEKDGLKVKVVNLGCWELFEEQSQKYKDETLRCNKSTLVVSIEAGITSGWQKYTGRNGLNIGIDSFGESGPGVDVANHFGINSSNLYQRIVSNLNNKNS